MGSRLLYFNLPLALLLGLLGGSVAQESSGTWQGKLAVGSVALALALAALHCYLALRSRSQTIRLRAWSGVVLTSFMALGGLTVSELVPLGTSPDKFQSDMLRVLKDRNFKADWTFRGAPQRKHCNNFGFPDYSHHYSRSPGVLRILFVGDSFLVDRAQKHLPERVETIMNLSRKTEVINLSLSDTGPLDYRFRIQELALQYHPDFLVVCLYEANDLDLWYKYQPYRSRAIEVPEETVEFAVQEHYPEAAISALRSLRQTRRIVAGRVEFDQILNVPDLTPERKDLLYMQSLAFAPDAGKPRAWLQNTRERLSRVAKQLLGLGRPRAWPNPASLATQARPIYDQPEETRLDSLCLLIGREYFAFSDGSQVKTLIQRQGPLFVNYLTATFDQWWYLVPGLQEALSRTGLKSDRLESLQLRKAPQGQVDIASQENLKLLSEIVKLGADQKVQVCFVLIPEASSVDSEFTVFWKGISDFRDRFSDTHQLYTGLARLLPQVAPTLDLGSKPDVWNGAYWEFDGHWKERGNQVAAEKVAQFLARQGMSTRAK